MKADTSVPTALLVEVDVADAVVAEALLIGDEQSAAAWRAAEQRVVAAKEREQAAEARAAAAEARAAAAEQRVAAAQESAAAAEQRVAGAHRVGREAQRAAEAVSERRLREQAEQLTAAIDAEALRAHEAERRAAAMEALLVAELHSVDQDELEECYNAMLGFEIMYNEEREFSKGCS